MACACVFVIAAFAAALGRFPSTGRSGRPIDEELTAKGYIVPGLGDAGDLAFGEKTQQ